MVPILTKMQIFFEMLPIGKNHGEKFLQKLKDSNMSVSDYIKTQDNECSRSLLPFEDLIHVEDVNDRPEWVFRSKLFTYLLLYNVSI